MPSPLCLASTPRRQPAWLIVDSLQGGSGQAFDWAALQRSAANSLAGHSTHGWLLAGGLTPDSVAGGAAAAHLPPFSPAPCLLLLLLLRLIMACIPLPVLLTPNRAL